MKNAWHASNGLHRHNHFGVHHAAFNSHHFSPQRRAPHAGPNRTHALVAALVAALLAGAMPPSRTARADRAALLSDCFPLRMRIRELIKLAERFNRGGDGTLIAPSEHLEIMITKK